jgi:hypothetical protein
MPFAIGTASVHRDPPHDRGDHDTPLWSGRDGCYVALIWGSEKQKYFRFAQIFRLTRIPKIGSDLPVGHPPVIPGRAKREPGIYRATELVDEWIPGLRQAAHRGMTIDGNDGGMW